MEDTKDHKKTIKRFGLISSIIFTVIVVFSVIWIQVNNQDNTVLSQAFNIIILTTGLIGLGYCILILRTFDSKIDKEILEAFNIEDNNSKEKNTEQKNNQVNNMSLDQKDKNKIGD